MPSRPGMRDRTMIRRTLSATSLALLTTLSGCASSDFSQIGQVLGQIGAPAGGYALSESEIVAGLREALAQGTTKAINQLGRSDGFWSNGSVRVPLPEPVAGFEKALRQFGQGPRVDEFHLTLNRAAEQAVPLVADIFGNAVRQMTLQDARAILGGPNDAATQYFRRVSTDSLRQKILPIVQNATARVGVTQSYKRMVAQAGPFMEMAGRKPQDLDLFVTDEALDGLFTMIAAEEARIRENPAARTTEILRRVFGSR